MKKIIKNVYSILAVMAVVVFMSSCEDEAIPMVEVSNISVASAYPLEDVTISGTNFNTIQFVFVGNRQASFQLDGDVLTFQVPAAATPGLNDVTLAMVNNYRVTTQLEVLVRPTPVIQSISPTAVAVGENVTIGGTSLENIESVLIGEVEATVVSANGTSLVVTVPDGLPNNTASNIKITTSGGETTSTSIFYVGENLLANGEFEAGDGDEFTNWNKFNGGDGLTATTSASEAYAGRALMATAVGGDAWRTQFASDPVATQVGVEYTVNMWIKAKSGTPGDGGNIRFSTNPNALYSGNYDITTEWQQIEWAFTANEASTRVVLDLGVIADAVYFVDNVTFVATGAAGPQPIELVLNGGFELGSGNDFTNWSKYNGGDLMTESTTEVHRGGRALRAVGAGADAWRTQMASDEMVTAVGVEYAVSWWIKGEGAGIGGSVRMSTAANAGAQYSGNTTVTGEWQKIEWAFTANDVLTRVVLDLGATADAVYYVDDVSVLAPPVEPAQSIALNGGLEEGSGDEFTNWNKFNGAELLTATTESSEVYKGSRALKAVGAGGDAWRTQFASDDMVTVVGTDYTASFWIKAEAGSPGDGGNVRMSTSANAGALYSANFDITTEWQKVEWTFTANDVLTKIVLDLGVIQDAVYFVDQIEVFEN